MRTLGLLAFVLCSSSALAAPTRGKAKPGASADAPACATLGQGLVPAGGGPPGSTGFANECCAGLKHVEAKDACGEAYGGYAGQCLACGDQKCDRQFENACNCPTDCRKP